MDITCDPAKRTWTLEHRGIDFMDASEVFAGTTLTLEDDRQDYGETRYQTYGWLAGRVVMVVWTPRGEARHVISMRHCHEREARKVAAHLD
ncbi:BrnT family toxin [Xanthobacter sp. DSM 24535]|uniref:BrnT family toxin n=1 Tax=Roseixanthobacter psychrophilus TaxID=3119917 RepID=UPI00372A2A1F